MGLDCRRVDSQLSGQLGVAQLAGQQPQYLEFFRGQVGQAGVRDELADRCGAKRSIRCRVMDGASSESPGRTMRTAATSCSGEVSLSRDPLAPAASAA